MFAVHEVTVEAPFFVAASRLTRLVEEGGLRALSEPVYEGALAAVLRHAPACGPHGFSTLARVRHLDPVSRADAVIVPMRWEGVDASGEPLPVLDADLVLAPAGARTALTVTGSYRLPRGRTGAAADVDTDLLGRVASATIRSLAWIIADAIVPPPPSVTAAQ